MSDSIRQTRIFGEDFEWEAVFEAFKEADFTAYDYDSVYRSITSYIKNKYGDEFNDFIRSSELFAHVNMMSFLAQNLAMRMDINTRDNYIEKSLRRDNILNMAYMLTHQPKRNIPCHGLLKVTGIQTTEDISDANMETLSSNTILWNQKGVFDWYDRFIRIIRNTLSDDNPFGSPSQEVIDGAMTTQVYDLKQHPSFNTVYSFKRLIEGSELNFNVVPSCIKNGDIIEDAPDSRRPFTIIYKSDGKGNASDSTGFFVQFKQGHLFYNDFTYQHPKYHRRETISVDNINNTDVWVQEITQDEQTKEHWLKVSSNDGQNIIYNEEHPSERKLFFVKTKRNDQVEIMYGDSNFSDVPLGKMRVWYRVSENIKYTVPAEYIKDIPVTIPYIGRDGRQHTLTLFLSNVSDNVTATPSPTNDDIVYRAPETRYTQDRMVNLSDYNIFSSSRLPFVRKMKVSNRDNSTMSRYQYLDSHDPTGAHSNLDVNADDGYVYNDYYETYTRFMYDEGKIDFDSFTQTTIERLINFDTFKTYYYNVVFYEFHKQDQMRFNMEFASRQLRWMNEDKTTLSQVGYFYTSDSSSRNPRDTLKVLVGIENGNQENKLWYIRPKSKLRFIMDDGSSLWTTVLNVETVRGYSRISVSDHIPTNARPDLVVPGMSGKLTPKTRDEILTYVNRQESFGLYYNFERDTWTIIPREAIVNTDDTYSVIPPSTPLLPDNRWLVKCIFKRDVVSEYYDVIVRGERLIFGSERQVRFYFNTIDSVLSTRTADVNKDHVTVLGGNAFSNTNLSPNRALFVSRLNPNIDEF